MSRKPKNGGFLEYLKILLYAGLLAWGVRTIAFEPFEIPSGSMIPTLLKGDRLFVSKYSYGYSRYSLPFSPPLFSGRIFEDIPERGDVAVFRKPRNTDIDYIKRIIGLPGDQIQMRQGVLYLNGQAVPRQLIGGYETVNDYGGVDKFTRYRETLPNGKSYFVIEESDTMKADNTGVYVVPEHHYFAMGDHRDNSRDSRFLNDVGYVPAENLIGRAEILIFSTDGSARLWEVWKWPFAIRYERILKRIV